MSFANEKGAERRSRTNRPGDTDGRDERKAGNKNAKISPELGSALRNAYQRTIAEDIPPEMLDLLGKLG